MKRILIVAVIMAMLMSGCSVMMSTMEQGATQPTVEEMLAQALQLCNAGNYEEAILLYEAIIEIEPNNYEAGYGLGHAYRSVGRTMDAISILKKAAKLSTDDKRAMYELFHTKIGVKLCSMVGGGVSRNLWNFFRTAPAGTGQAVTCSTSGMGLRLK